MMDEAIAISDVEKGRLWGLNRYQWLVIVAAWLGWGFDCFDALLFNFVSRLCIPDLLHLKPGSPGIDQTINAWTGGLTSLLLVGWGVGGIIFGKITDRIGRARTLLLTMLTYSIGTAACAAATNIWMLIACRIISALGIGGEWAAGASLVAESVPERKRVLAGALMYTASPIGLLLATFVTDLFTRRWESIAGNPSLAWRMVFLSGLIPAAAAGALRLAVREPAKWKAHHDRPRVAELFSPALRGKTIGGSVIAVSMMLGWWTSNSFLPRIAGQLAVSDGKIADQAHYVTVGTTAFNLGGLLGTLMTIPIAMRLGRRSLFVLYFGGSAIAMYLVFGCDISALVRLRMMFLVGIFVYGVFGALPFYLPELFPTRLRGTGAGFCYNIGRFIAAFGPFAVPGLAAAYHTDLLHVVSWCAIFPAGAVVLILLGLGHETRDAELV
ncbi:MAG: MFS transporter [Planctomycetes bacterium]|nr:MFS transporter [Planctomycetota bacterium]MBI3835240.1 MFS transporter [Planctomycetota bacterium]